MSYVVLGNGLYFGNPSSFDHDFTQGGGGGWMWKGMHQKLQLKQGLQVKL
jgi:hypothetical protein